MRVRPFRGLRYDPVVAGPHRETSAPPYDDLDPIRYAGHRTSNPYTVLELLTGESGGRAGHSGARATLDRWQRTGVLRTDDPPGLYLYEEHEVRDGVPATQRGILAAVDLADVDEGRLLLHEHVDDDRARRRAQRLTEVPLDITPVVAVHLGGTGAELRPALDDVSSSPPMVTFTDESAVEHRLWHIADPAAVDRLCAAYDPVTAVLADGHHRVAAARQVRDTLRAAGHAVGGWGATTAWLVDADDDGPELRAVHRLVDARLPSLADGTPLAPGFNAVSWEGSTTDLERYVAASPTLAFGVVTAGGRWALEADDPAAVYAAAASTAGPLLAGLDAQVLASLVLPSLGTPATHAAPDAGLAARALHEAADRTLILLRPPTPQQVLDIALAGERMPAKTTWYRPKPRAGLVMRRLDADT
ncbi:DUF1015 domain-containing protein [soil metagenome]